jgi:hypothetical protein
VRPTARWSLGGAALRAGRSDISVPAAAADVDALAAAHREAIGRLSGQLPAAISPRH